MPTLFVNNFTKVEGANSATLTASNITSNSVTLTATGLTVGATYRINIFNNSNVLKSHWDLNSVINSTIITTSPSIPPLLPDTYIAKLSDGVSYVAVSSPFTILETNNLPQITSFSPTSGKWNDTVTINGTNFTGSTLVYFGEIVSSIPSTINNTVITVKVPRAAVTGYLYIIKPGFEDTRSATDFIVNTSVITPTCSDGIRNQNETGIDTGGVCGGAVNKPLAEGGGITFSGIVPVCNTGDIDPETNNYVNACDFNMLMTLINKVITFLLITLATPLFALIIIYVAWLYLSAGGSSENVTKAKKILKNALIGYVIALAAWLIVKTILISLGFTGPMFLG